MRDVGKHIEKDGSGYVKLTPQSAEDLWHLYNLITKGDEVQSTTFRKVSLLTQKIREPE